MRYLRLIRNIDNWQQYFLYKCGLVTNEPLVFSCKNRVVAEVPVRLLQTFKEIFFDECYTRHLPTKLLQNGMTVVDIGANAGYFSLYVLSRYPGARVIAFEPIPKNFELLEKNRQRNSMHDLITVKKAVYGTGGIITLKYNAQDSFTTAGSIFDNALGGDEIEVYTMTLPEIFREYGVKVIDVLKLDCEGSEYHILYHCPEEYLRLVNSIAVECHRGEGENENRGALCGFLRSLAYRIRTDKGGLVWAWREERGDGGLARFREAAARGGRGQDGTTELGRSWTGER